MSWLLSTLAMSPVVATFLAYWLGLHTAARLLPKERLTHRDYRVVPDLYRLESSHRWFGIIVGEKTGNYSQRLRRALALARVAVVLLPFALMVSVALLATVRIEPPDAAGSVMPSLTIPVSQ
jgi:multidrug efflux pump subunit AcrB